jgi:hypothetical protein
MVEKRYMGAQEVAFGRKVRATQRIGPSEIFAPEHVAGSIASSIRLSGTQGGVS